MEPGPSLAKQVSLDYIDLAKEGPSVSKWGFLNVVDHTDLSLDVHEYTSVDHIDLTGSAAKQRVSLSHINLMEKGEPVQQTEHWFIDLTGGEE